MNRLQTSVTASPTNGKSAPNVLSTFLISNSTVFSKNRWTWVPGTTTVTDKRCECDAVFVRTRIQHATTTIRYLLSKDPTMCWQQTVGAGNRKIREVRALKKIIIRFCIQYAELQRSSGCHTLSLLGYTGTFLFSTSKTSQKKSSQHRWARPIKRK